MAKKKGSEANLKAVEYTLPTKGEKLDATLSIRLPEELKAELQKFCKKKKLKVNTLINHIIEEFLDGQ
ncbi:ribbon-helix-helix protein, CopG family [Bacteriovorax sp. BAL6_X]|uniref:CopG family transcriptional regulator n=1 Tax=Bacteriovorax sp. BAL6_X TaxID=1201290 RepID=UPI000385C00F|nr:CopG family transcriptional regulator [Bacteriovorax sp. BAL6_X]EPZ51804.1 ribbon-helix-helix protein, CopG family [Bacteriovorax sp. BAL6_X]